MFWKKRNNYFNVNSEKQKHGRIIGVVGTGRGVGVTHFCILLAEYIAIDKGSFVAILECNNHGDLKWMELNLYGEGTHFFSFHNVDYYTGVVMDNLDDILKKEYRYLILDFGEKLSGKEKLINLCQKKILLGVESWWKKDAMKEKQSYFSMEGFECFYNLSKQGIPYSRLNQVPTKRVQKVFERILNL